VSRPVNIGGLGFGYKWNMGWMHDTLRYVGKDPIHRKYHHGEILFGLHYAFSENFILPLSHDEVVHGKRSILGRMPGDDWQRFANLRAYYSFMFGHPGKKLLFMGCEIAQEREWNHDSSLDWHLLGDPKYAGIQALIRDLNHLYRNQPALHERDCEPEGFDWLITEDADRNVFAWVRKGFDERARCVVVVNFSPNVYYNYRVRVPLGGTWREVFNSDSSHYGGSNVGNVGQVHASEDQQLNLILPPMAAVFLVPEA
jgi:1,4-alpha-glucan branching enzyme